MIGTLTSSGFPLVNESNSEITSDIDPRYNCIAWAAEDSKRWWWPDPVEKASYWPTGVVRTNTVESFVKAFGTLGYEVCNSADLEGGFQKVALYVNSTNLPTHMARQLNNGVWTSKMGKWHDISHATPDLLNGPIYGSVAVIMSRQIVSLEKEISMSVNEKSIFRNS